MTTLTSRVDRNSLSAEDQVVVQKYRAMVARELQTYISDSDLSSIKNTPKDELIRLHHSLGTSIRNEYELWMPEHDVTNVWTRANAKFPLVTGPVLEDIEIGDRIVRVQATAEIDEHPCHPDNFSYSCIEQLWENLQ